MDYKLELSDKIYKKFKRLEKRSRKQLLSINKKVKQILENPYHFKLLRGDMKGSRRVHISSFILVYEILESRKIIRLLDYDHHDKIY